MKELSESKTVQKAYLKIDLCYLQIEKARKEFEDKYKNMSEFDMALAVECGAYQSDGMKYVGIWAFNLTKLIKFKKIIDADWGQDQKVLDGLNKMLQKSN